jgi:hypothetical protein
VVDPGQTGVDPDGIEIPIITGDVQLATNNEVRSTLDVTTAGVSSAGVRMWPNAANDLLAPFGKELFVERGIQYKTGDTEWVSLGYHKMFTVEQDNPPDGPLRIAAKDRMSSIVDAKLINPVQFAAAATRAAVMERLVLEVYPYAVIEWADSAGSVAIGKTLVAEEDRYKFLNDLVTSAGRIWYWNHEGKLIIKPAPSPSAPVWDVDHGENGVLVSMGRDLTREGVFNGVVATGSGDAPARAVVVDGNSNSPTYWWGAYGKVPTFYQSEFLPFNADALAAATALLSRSLGTPYVVQFGSIVNPALEVLDPIRVVYPDRARSRSDVTETHIIETLTVPLSPEDAQAGTTREQTEIMTVEVQ